MHRVDESRRDVILDFEIHSMAITSLALTHNSTAETQRLNFAFCIQLGPANDIRKQKQRKYTNSNKITNSSENVKTAKE
jgi:hypothetical protein